MVKRFHVRIVRRTAFDTIAVVVDRQTGKTTGEPGFTPATAAKRFADDLNDAADYITDADLTWFR